MTIRQATEAGASAPTPSRHYRSSSLVLCGDTALPDAHAGQSWHSKSLHPAALTSCTKPTPAARAACSRAVLALMLSRQSKATSMPDTRLERLSPSAASSRASGFYMAGNIGQASRTTITLGWPNTRSVQNRCRLRLLSSKISLSTRRMPPTPVRASSSATWPLGRPRQHQHPALCDAPDLAPQPAQNCA